MLSPCLTLVTSESPVSLFVFSCLLFSLGFWSCALFCSMSAKLELNDIYQVWVITGVLADPVFLWRLKHFCLWGQSLGGSLGHSVGWSIYNLFLFPWSSFSSTCIQISGAPFWRDLQDYFHPTPYPQWWNESLPFLDLFCLLSRYIFHLVSLGLSLYV